VQPIGRFANEVPRQRKRGPERRPQIMIVLDDEDGRPALEELRVRYNRYIQAIFSLSPETSIASLSPKTGQRAHVAANPGRRGLER